MSKKKVVSSRAIRAERAQLRAMVFFSAAILLMKVIWLSSQPGRGLLGADGENYFNSLEGLLKDGIFSEQVNLHYWPAGYPILMWPLAELSLNSSLFLVGIIQSVIFAFSVTYFSIELSRSSLKRFSWPALILLSVSPTFTLNSLVIGYEVTSAVLFLLSIALYLRLIRLDRKSGLTWEAALAALAISISCFMQPRIMLLALGVFIPFAIYHYRGKAIPIFLTISLGIVAIAPATLIFRNIQAQGFAAISTNLGTTMNIGAGPKSTGGWTNSATGVPCEAIEGDAAQQDAHKVGCVLNWYLANPSLALRLFVNKFFYFWSPWFGPLASGTMARNPWFKHHPFAETAKTQEGRAIVYGNLGKLISWAWVLGSLALMGYGFLTLRRRGGLSTFLAWALFIPILLNTASSMGTIGDHRFRIPTLSLSLLLQLFGAYALFARKSFRRGVDGPLLLARGLNWKGRGQGDNLLP
jgi:hypothetical protein